ncbi:MAG: hypothetical protein BMS9Abin36_0832 [Gammaproteobacteria bacterium]|nr:MAG: hypothetical protein BMS9Abin36_0832 [Gammaproteobacteria bacterium]
MKPYKYFIFIFALILNPAFAGKTVYIPLGSANLVIAVDAKSDTITATFTGVKNPHGLVATPDGEYLVAGSLSESPPSKDNPKGPTSKLFFIHPAHGHVMSTIPVMGWTHHQAITPDGRYVLSTHGMRNNVSVVDLQSNKVVRTITTGPVPNYTIVTKDGARAFVTNSGNGTIAEIDIGQWKVVRTLQAGPAPEHMVISKDGRMLYVANSRAGTISEVSITSGKVIKQHKIGQALHGLDIGDDGETLFISSKKDNKLVALNLKTGRQRMIALSPAPYHLNTIHGTGKVYVSSSKKPKIWVVDQATLKITGEIKLPGGEGHQMAIVD